MAGVSVRLEYGVEKLDADRGHALLDARGERHLSTSG
jgi:hypothetical protein